jgi:hypothetical protein
VASLRVSLDGLRQMRASHKAAHAAARARLEQHSIAVAMATAPRASDDDTATQRARRRRSSKVARPSNGTDPMMLEARVLAVEVDDTQRAIGRVDAEIKAVKRSMQVRTRNGSDVTSAQLGCHAHATIECHVRT